MSKLRTHFLSLLGHNSELFEWYEDIFVVFVLLVFIPFCVMIGGEVALAVFQLQQGLAICFALLLFIVNWVVIEYYSQRRL